MPGAVVGIQRAARAELRASLCEDRMVRDRALFIRGWRKRARRETEKGILCLLGGRADGVCFMLRQMAMRHVAAGWVRCGMLSSACICHCQRVARLCICLVNLQRGATGFYRTGGYQ
jgi:hypothetical protein